MTSSLVGSEMCIRDRKRAERYLFKNYNHKKGLSEDMGYWWPGSTWLNICLLYTSDAADDM
eukprot:10751280-Prorocentrum_lima.AAC.1